MVTRAMVTRAIARTRPIETIGQAYEWLRTRALPRGVAFLTEGDMNTERTHQDDGVSLSGERRAIYSLHAAIVVSFSKWGRARRGCCACVSVLEHRLMRFFTHRTCSHSMRAPLDCAERTFPMSTAPN